MSMALDPVGNISLGVIGMSTIKLEMESLGLAAGVFAGLGIVVDPAVGAIFMSLSTVLVASNNQTLHRYKP
jgi:hypothetical protein